MAQFNVGNLTAAIYDAALETRSWPDVLGQIGAAVDAAVIMAVHPWSGGVEWAALAGIDPASLPVYEHGFSSAETNPYLKACRDVPLGEPFAAETFTTPESFDESDFYQRVLAPQRLLHTVVLTLLRDEQRMAAAAFARKSGAAPFGDTELQLLRDLAPHLQRALQLTLRIEHLRAHSTALSEALSTSPVSTLLADADRRVAFLNLAASAILKDADGLTLTAGRIDIHDATARAAFADRLTRAARIAPPARNDSKWKNLGPLLIPRPSGKPGYHLWVWPLRLEAAFGPANAPTAVVMLRDPLSDDRPPSHTLAAICGLTPSETELAALLLRGLTLKAAADELGVSINTVKTHLKQVFAKTNTRRQTELMRLMMQFPPIPSSLGAPSLPSGPVTSSHH